MEEEKAEKEKWGKKLSDQFMAGILVIVPVGATVLILVWLFNSIDNILQPAVNFIFGRTIPGVGFGATIVLIYLAGVIVRNFIGKKLIRYGESLIVRIPVFRQFYSGIRQILEAFTTPEKASFMQVVLAQFPKDGMWTIGFITNEITQPDGEKLFNVFIPTSPTPWSGFFQILTERDIIRTSISVQDAVKMVVSCGSTVTEEARKNIKIK
jgi:uncharacterized membrane protein